MSLITDNGDEGPKKEDTKYENPKILSLGQSLFSCMKNNKDKVAQYIADTDETVTYGDLLTRCIRTALKLNQIGVTRNDIISSCTSNHKNSWVPFIAAQFLGIVTANFDPSLSHLDSIQLLKLIQPKIIFVSTDSVTFIEKCLKESKVHATLVVFGEDKKYTEFSEYLQPKEEEENFKPTSINSDKETAAILFSSGTTGLPKGICIHHLYMQALFSNEERIANNLGSTKQTVHLFFTTLYWISAVSFLVKSILGGGICVMCSQFNPANTWKIIEKYKVNFLFLAPYHARDFLAYRPENANISSLKIFFTGTCLITNTLLDELKRALPQAIVLQGYGQTESGVTTTFNIFDPEQLQMLMRKPQSVGKIRTGVEWKIVDPITEEVLGPNQKGEMRIKSDLIMNGYYKMDSSSEFDSEGYFKTGDILYYDEEECFYVVDRIKEMFKYRGWHILPQILEHVIMTHPAVKEAVVIGFPHEIDGDHPMALVVLYAGNKGVTPKDIELYVEGKVSENQRLRAGVKFIKDVVRTATGKIRRKVMRQMVLDNEL